MASLVKPTANTPYHIDFDWWKKNDNNWRVYLTGCLCSDHQQLFANLAADSSIDMVDMQTGEVTQVDGITAIIEHHCSKQPGFIDSSTKLLDAVFKALLINENRPMTLNEISKIINRPADTILRTITGGRVYLGLRPYV